jgi:hypothetical protein
MKRHHVKLFLLCLALLSIFAGELARAQDQPPDYVNGNWTIYAKDPDGGTSTGYTSLGAEHSVMDVYRAF